LLRRVPKLLLPICLARLEGRRDVVGDLGRNLDRRDDFTEEVRELFLADVRVATGAARDRRRYANGLAVIDRHRKVALRHGEGWTIWSVS